MEFDPKKLVQLHTIAFSGADPASRMIGFSHAPDFWQRFIRFYTQPMFDWGIRRFLLHCPAGAVKDKVFEFDQFVRAEDAGLDWLLRDFVDAWRAFQARNPGVEIICYLGTITGDKDFDEKNPAAWLRRAEKALRYPLDAGMSFGFDACVDAPLDSPFHRLAQLVTSFGRRVYVEGFPSKAQPHWAQFNVISQTANLHRAKSDGWGMPYNEVKGEIIDIADSPPEGHDWNTYRWELDYWSGLLSEGFSLCAPFNRLAEQHQTMRHLADALKSSK